MHTLRNLALLMLTACLVLVGSACSSSKKKASPAAVLPNTITINNFAFSPQPLTVHAGVNVTVRNSDTTDHTVTADDNKSFDTKHVTPGATATFTPAAKGTYKYHCNIHQSMTGTLIVN